MQVPGPTNLIVAPFGPPAVHTDGVVVVNVTSSPDDEVADTVIGDAPIGWSLNAANVIV